MQGNIFEKDYKIYLIGFFIIAALPFVNFQPWLSPPAWGKAIIFRIIISFFIYLFLYRVITEKKYSIFKELLKNKIVLLLLVLLLLYVLSTIFSLDPHFSFWGSPLRAGGSLNYILLIIFSILAFLIVKDKDWQKLWDISFLMGILITLVAAAQKLNIFSGFIIPRTDRAIGTIGGPAFLALYLCLLLFMALSFAIKTKSKKRWVYLGAALLYLLGVVLSGSRGAILAVGITSVFYALFYPSKKLKWLKISSLACAVLIVLFFWAISGHPALIKELEQNKIAGNAFERIWSSVEPLFTIKSFSLYDVSFAVFRERKASWIISSRALKEKPLLGFGPENFSIAFDKYFDISLPRIEEGNMWWDRAHNFIFDISVTAGIPTLIVFLLLLGFLLFKLQKDKDIIKHGLQATFIAYIINNLFNFDVFSTFLLFFFAVAYTLHLTSKKPNLEPKPLKVNENPFRSAAFVIAFIVLLFFIWFGALKPLWINKEINVANAYLSQGKKDLAIQKMENILTQKSNIRNYTLLQYVEIVNVSMNVPPLPTPEKRLQLTQKASEALKESSTLRPYYTRTWWSLNIYSNYFLGVLQNPPEEIKKEAIEYCQKAKELSPEHWKILKDCTTTYLTLEDYDNAIKAADECIALKPSEGICRIRKAMACLALGQLDLAKENVEAAKQRNYPEQYEFAQRSQIIGFYNSLLKKDINQETKEYLYSQLIELYQGLISSSLEIYKKDNPQYHASLAYVYKQSGDMKKAKEEAEIVLQLAPDAAKTADEFLKDLQL
jgi:tetratricopeptide (TPR) repeat protein